MPNKPLPIIRPFVFILAPLCVMQLLVNAIVCLLAACTALLTTPAVAEGPGLSQAKFAFALCARFSTRYEAHHVLPWIKWHTHLGVEHFYLYFDALSSDLTVPAQRIAYARVAALAKPPTNPRRSSPPLVTLFNTTALRIEHEGRALRHCVRQVGAQAEWGMDMDIDEVIVGGKVLAADCAGRGSFKHLLTRFTAGLEAGIRGVVVPRVDFGPNGHRQQPAATQMQAYTLRPALHAFVKSIGLGKVIFRGTAAQAGDVVVDSKHEITSVGRKGAATGIIYPDGSAGHCMPHDDVRQRAGNGTNGRHGDERPGRCRVGTRGYAATSIFRHLRMHHYVTRSLDECSVKMRDVDAPWQKTQAMSPWRKLYYAAGAGQGPAASLECTVQTATTDVEDYTAACYTRGHHTTFAHAAPNATDAASDAAALFL